MENHNFLTGKSTINGHVQYLFVCLPEGININQNWGTGKSAVVSRKQHDKYARRKNAFGLGKTTLLYWLNMPSPGRCYATKAHQQALISALSCALWWFLKNLWWEPPPVAIRNPCWHLDLSCTMGAQNEEWMWMPKLCKYTRKVRSRVCA